jgi:hypothetical protein
MMVLLDNRIWKKKESQFGFGQHEKYHLKRNLLFTLKSQKNEPQIYLQHDDDCPAGLLGQ